MKKYIIAIALICIIGLGVGYLVSTNQAVGSVIQGNEYNSTTTSASFLNHSVLKTGHGSLANVVITGTNPAAITFYDATTTDATKRTKAATTTLASFQTTATPNSYPIDSNFSDGLLVDFGGGTGSTTITWR